MPKELEFTVYATIMGKTYEGRRVVTIKGKKATQYIISDERHFSITDHEPYNYPADSARMEAAGQIIFAELLGKTGIQ